MLHTIPVGGEEPVHSASGKCFCHPAPDQQFPGTLLVHNAADARERFERQGLTHPDKRWVIVAQED